MRDQPEYRGAMFLDIPPCESCESMLGILLRMASDRFFPALTGADA